MMRRSFLAIAATGLAAVLMSSSSAQAGTSTQGFNALDTVTQSGSTYTLAHWTASFSQTGLFAGYPQSDFGAVAFDTSSQTGLSFGDSTFGTFESTSVTLEVWTPTGALYYILGNWTPGSHSSDPAAGSASITLAITNNSGVLGATAQLFVPPGPPPTVPEPSSVVLGLASLAIGGLTYGLRRRRSA